MKMNDSDLISRQDAIEAFADMRNGYPVVHGDMLSDKDVIEIIKELPSAQPESVIRITGTRKHVSDFSELDEQLDDAYAHGYTDAECEFRKIMERKKGKWIKDICGAVICSNCGGIRRDNRIEHIGWCNRCGANMKGEEDE